MAQMTAEQLHWLQQLKQHRPGNDSTPLRIPGEVAEYLIAQRLAYRRNGGAIEITFDGVQVVMRTRADGARENPVQSGT